MSYHYGMNLTEEERINKNVRDMMETKKGTVPYDRDMGVDTSFLSKAAGTYPASLLTDITDMLNEREERAECKVSQNDDYTLRVEVTIDD